MIRITSHAKVLNEHLFHCNVGLNSTCLLFSTKIIFWVLSLFCYQTSSKSFIYLTR